jgi:hypothetical protein
MSFLQAVSLSSLVNATAKRLRTTTFRSRRNFSIADGQIRISTVTSLAEDQPVDKAAGMHKMFKLYSLMDQDNSGNVDAGEFVTTFEGVVDPTFRRWIMIATGFGNRDARSDEEFRQCLHELFRLADANGDGSLSVLEFKALFKVSTRPRLWRAAPCLPTGWSSVVWCGAHVLAPLAARSWLLLGYPLISEQPAHFRVVLCPPAVTEHVRRCVRDAGGVGCR